MNAEAVQPPAPTSKSKKNKKKKAAKKKANGDTAQAPATADVEANDEDEGDEDDQVADDPVTPNGVNKPSENGPDSSLEGESTNPSGAVVTAPGRTLDAKINGPSSNIENDANDTNTRFDALVQDRDNLRSEVTELRKSLEALQHKHDSDLEGLQTRLDEAQGEKDHAESQYRNLLGKVNTIKSQLGERLKADAEELSQARTRIEELEERKAVLEEESSSKNETLASLNEELEAQSKELSTLRNRTNLTQQTWTKERDQMLEQESYLREEFENAKQAMHDWEVLAMEERSIRRSAEEKAADLEEQVNHFRDAFEKAAGERDTQSSTVDGLQKALQEIQNARKQELRELVESSQKEEEALRKQLQEAEKTAAEAQSELEKTKTELERALPFEKEVKEKNLLIGKLRHEAVILNDHLTKALRFLKKGKPEDNVDRQIVTNHFLHFLALERSDPKKFQVLQLIAALLNWTEEQREQAGLSRPGGMSQTGTLRSPSTAYHRTPSTPALTADYFADPHSSAASKETLAELWQSFLEQEAQQGSLGSKSRRSSSITVPKVRSASDIKSPTTEQPPKP